MKSAIIAVVTGANRGIGLAICQTLAATTSEQPMVLYAVSRTGANLDTKSASKAVEVRYDKLSLTDKASMTALAARLQKEHGGCDVLINNAGVYHYSEDATLAQQKEMLDVNYRGTLAVCQAFLPIMREKARIVNVSSQSGLLKYFSPSLQARFRNPDKTLQDVESLVQEYEDAAAQGIARESGWPRMTYFTSKAAENAITSILARENPGFFINCCCPGWVGTDLGNQAGAAPKTVVEGARIPIRLGFGDIGGSSGTYWANPSVFDKGDGAVQVW